jgi:hypothetical protein
MKSPGLRKRNRKKYFRNYYLQNRGKILQKNRLWSKDNRKRVNSLARKNHLKNRISRNAAQRRWAQSHPEAIKNRRYKTLYGLNLKFVEEQKIKQRNRCLICSHQKELFVDHNHRNGKFRGLLCRKCNAGLGMFGDSIKNLEGAIRYLKGD